MNRYIETANFDVEKFPLDCGTLRGMQDNTAIMAVLAQIAAGKETDRLILCGCEDMGNGFRSEGYIWLLTEQRPNIGEIIYHAEQRLYDKFLIETKAEDVEVDGVSYPELYRHREANDSSIGTEKWSDYMRMDGMSNVALETQIISEIKARAEALESLRALLDDSLTSLSQSLSNEGMYRSAKDRELEAMIKMRVPKGVICIWSGSIDSIPSGWALCDGNNGTPDLRARFVIGAGKGYAPNILGGSGIINLNANQIPRLIDVTFPGGNSRVESELAVSGSGISTKSRYNAGYRDGDNDSNGKKLRLVIGQEKPNPVHVMPPYYSLAYIMKL